VENAPVLPERMSYCTPPAAVEIALPQGPAARWRARHVASKIYSLAKYFHVSVDMRQLAMEGAV